MNRKDIFSRLIGLAAAGALVPAALWIAPGAASAAVSSAALSLGYDRRSSGESESAASAPLLTGSPASSGSADLTPAPGAPAEPSPEPEQEAEPLILIPEKPPAGVLAAIPYPADQNSEDGPVVKMNFGHCDGEQYFDLDGDGQVRNCTDRYSNDELLAESRQPVGFSIDNEQGEPLVLIYHTHTTESYEPEDRDFYDASFPSKTTDPEKNVTAVGDRICEQLEAAGIACIHDTLVHDYPSYNDAYDSSRETVLQLLERYPSVKIALDIHRDGIQREDGTRLSPVAEIDGREAAQIMIISGCDDGTMGLPEHLKNFRFACTLQTGLESRFPGLTRPVLFDYRHYNQDLTTGSLLIEVGSHGNSLDQALYSGELIGKGLAEVILGLGEQQAEDIDNNN